MRGVLIRSRVQWLAEGEKPSKYFCALEHHNYLDKTIKRKIKLNGNICTEQNEILSGLL